MSDRTARLYRAVVPARRVGAGAPLVLLNSLATTTTIWHPLLPQLSESRDVLLIDYPGHGYSPAGSGPTTLDELASDIFAAVDAAGMTHVHIAGASVGGLAGLRLAALDPARIRSLVVIGSTPVMAEPLWRRRSELVAEFGTAGITDEVLERWFTDEFAERHPSTVARYRDMLAGTADSAYRTFCGILGGLDLRRDLETVGCATLVVSGAADAAATPEQGRLIADGVADGRHAVLDGVAHMIQAMAPRRLARLIDEHLTVAESSLLHSP